MQRKTKFCVQVHYVMESICINKHMFAQRNLQLTRIELWITKNSQKNGRKFRENWNKVLIVSDDVGWNFQSPGMTSKYGNLTKNTQIKSDKTSKKKYKWSWKCQLFKSIHQFPCWPKVIPSIPFKAHIQWENGCGTYRNIAGTIFHL